jgi:hypothetical protein
MQQMLSEGFKDLTYDDTGCVIMSANFIADVTVDGENKQQSFYVSSGLTDYPSDYLWGQTLTDVLESYNGISKVEIDYSTNEIKIYNKCVEGGGCLPETVYYLSDANIVINLKLEYNISCVQCITTPTPTPTKTLTPTPTSTPTPTPICDCLFISGATEDCGASLTTFLYPSIIVDGYVSFTGVTNCGSLEVWGIEYNSGSTQWEAYLSGDGPISVLPSTSDYPIGVWIPSGTSIGEVYSSNCIPCPTPTPTLTPTLTKTPTLTPTLTPTPTIGVVVPSYLEFFLSYSATICGVPQTNWTGLPINDVKCAYLEGFNPLIQVNNNGGYYYDVNDGLVVGTQLYSYNVFLMTYLPYTFTGNYVYSSVVFNPPLYVMEIVNGIIVSITDFDNLPVCSPYICP